MHARKSSRAGNMSDTFNWLMMSSDPFMSGKRRTDRLERKRGQKRKTKFDQRKSKRKLFKY